MDVTTRARRTSAQWVFLAVLVLFLIFGPSLVASIVTNQQGTGTSFLRTPWDGWTFTGRVLAASTHGDAASPGAAMSAANRAFATDHGHGHFTAQSVELVYVPGTSTIAFSSNINGDDHKFIVDPKPKLVWRITGVENTTNKQATIGLLSLTSAKLVWDVREQSRKDLPNL